MQTSQSTQIDTYISSQPSWQKDNLELFRKLIHDVDSNIEEGWKWDVPVFLKNGKLICAMSTFKEHTKFNFFNGASLTDNHKLFNSGLDSKKHRSINLLEGESINESKLKNLIEQALH